MDTPTSTYVKQPKDKPITVVSTVIKACHRERKFKEGEQGRECPFGFQAIDLSLCTNCRWLTDVVGQSRSRGYDEAPDIMEIAVVMKGIRKRK